MGRLEVMQPWIAEPSWDARWSDGSMSERLAVEVTRPTADFRVQPDPATRSRARVAPMRQAIRVPVVWSRERSCESATLVDNFVGAQQQRSWQRKAEGARGAHVDDKFELGRLFDRQLRRFGALEYSVDVQSALPVHRA